MNVLLNSISIRNLSILLILSFFEFVFGKFIGSILLLHKFDLFRYGRLYPISEDEEQNYVGNFAIMVLWPSLFMTLVCAIMQTLGNKTLIYCSIFLVVFFWIIRLLNTIVMNRRLFINWKFHIISAICSILLGIITWKLFIIRLIESDQYIGIPLDEFRNAIWFAIICLIIKMIWELVITACNETNLNMDNITTTAVIHNYKKFKAEYDDYIEKCMGEISVPSEYRVLVKTVLYSVIIIEDYNRPWLVRNGESIITRLHIKKNVTQGIAQYPENRVINDKESIRLRIEKIVSDWKGQGTLISRDIINHINNRSDYLNAVSHIANTLSKYEYGKTYFEIEKELFIKEIDEEDTTVEESEDSPVGTFQYIYKLIASGEYERAIAALRDLESKTQIYDNDFNEPLFIIYNLLVISYDAIGRYKEASWYIAKTRNMVLKKSEQVLSTEKVR